MSLSPEQQQQAINWINSLAKNPMCPICGQHGTYRINDEVMAVFPVNGDKTDFTRSAQLVIFTCGRCAHVRFFSAAMMGIKT